MIPIKENPKEIFIALTMIYKNMKSIKHRPPDGNKNFFNIVTKVVQGDILVPYMFVIFIDYVF